MSLAWQLNRNQQFSEPLQELLFTTLYTADQLERKLMRFLKPFGLTPWQYDILVILQDAGGQLSTGEIGKRLLRPSRAVGVCLDRLENAALISRSRSEIDRRKVQVSIELTGRTMLERITGRLSEWEEGVIGHLTHEEAVTGARILRKSAEAEPR